jgi:predicted CXXCH cytochrome family protein
MYEQSIEEEGARVMRKVSSPMKRLLFIGLGSAMMFAMGGVGSASADGGPHSIPMANAGQTGVIIANMGADQCANCHRAHTAKTDTLTMLAQPAICLNCHNSLGGQLDVTSGSELGVGALRGGGFTTARIDSGNAKKDMGAVVSGRIATLNQTIPVLATGTAVTSSHQIDGTTAGTEWGNGTTGVGQTAVTLECGSCHDPHGNGNYRILKAAPTGSQYIVTPQVGVVGDANYAKAVLSTATNVNIPDQPTKVYTTTNYWDVQAVGTPNTHVAWGATPATDTTVGKAASGTSAATPATDGYLGNISAWCTTCHTRYLSSSAGNTPTAGETVYTYKHRSDEGLSSKPNCIQCHVSHGSNAAMTGAAAAVAQPDGSLTGALNSGTVIQSAGDSRLLRVDNRGVCLECHNM